MWVLCWRPQGIAGYPGRVITELLPTLKPRKRSLVDVGIDRRTENSHSSKWKPKIPHTSFSLCSSVRVPSAEGRGKETYWSVSWAKSRIERDKGQIWRGKQISSTTAHSEVSNRNIYLLWYLRGLLSLDCSNILIISTLLGSWLVFYCLLPPLSFFMIWGCQLLPWDTDFLNQKYLPEATCKYWVNIHLVNCSSVSMRLSHLNNYAILLSGYEIITYTPLGLFNTGSLYSVIV